MGTEQADFDVIIIGAGMSGLAAGIRLAYFGKRVCIFERHYAFGGLNSYYRLGSREFDVGLHAVTNYAPPGVRHAPLNKLLRQLRIDREEFDLREQTVSEVCFPSCRLRFSNDPELLISEVAARFPGQADRFLRLVETVRAHDDATLTPPSISGRKVLAEHLTDPLLSDMLLCPLMYYGCPDEHDMDFTQLVTLFKSVFLEGFARPREGVRRIIRTLVRHYRASGGQLRMRCGVRRLLVSGGAGRSPRITGVELDNGETVTAPIVLSCAGYVETLRLAAAEAASATAATPATLERKRRLSFLESIFVLDARPAELGYDRTITFFSTTDRFHYSVPRELIDPRSGVICCPNNYRDHEHLPEGVLRFTSLASYDRWSALSGEAYAAAKDAARTQAVSHALLYLPDFRPHAVFADTFTPTTIERYTGHIGGAVYGSSVKHRDGRTPFANLFVCGTDQGYLGIIGALISGITMANLHVLGAE